jgi:RNA polymerase sigma-70 factor (ECF subfamily)
MSTEVSVRELGNELRAALSDDTAFRAWYDRTFPRVHGYVASRAAGDMDLAQDITQQTYMAAIAQRTTFDGRSDSVTWLCGIARHKLVDHFRRQDREQRRQRQIVVRNLHLEAMEQAAEWSAPEERELIATALRSLPPLQRAVITLVAMDGLSVPDAARLVGKSRGATQSLLARARDGFRQAWTEEARHG